MKRVERGYKFELVPGVGDSGNNLFKVVEKDGVSQLRTSGPIDYEDYALLKNPYVSIRLRVTDSRGNSFEKKITLNILDGLEVPLLLAVDVVMLGAGGGAGGAQGGQGGPGGSGSQYAFSFAMEKGVKYAFNVGGGGLGGLSSASNDYLSTGGPSGESGYGSSGGTLYGGRGGHAGPNANSGGGGGGGGATALSVYKRRGMAGKGYARLAVAAAGGGGTGRGNLTAYAGRGGDPAGFKANDTSLSETHFTVGGIGYINLDDGPGGGGGGGGDYGGVGANKLDGSFGGKSATTRRGGFMGVKGQENIPGLTGNLALATRVSIGSSAGKWWNNQFPAGAGEGGFSGSTISDRVNSNGKDGAAIIRYKETDSPRLDFGGTYVLSNGYHTHTFSSSGQYEMEVKEYG